MEKQNVEKSRDLYLEELRILVGHALGSSVVSIVPLEGGMNNLLHKINLEDGRECVAKQYCQDNRPRLQREYDVLSILSGKGFLEVPVPFVRFNDLRVGVYSFAEGRQIDSSDFSTHELDAIVIYLTRLQAVSPNEVAKELLRAQSSAFSLKEVADLILERVRPFKDGKEEVVDPAIAEFIQETKVLSSVEVLLVQLEERFSGRFYQEIVSEDRRLSSVDSGPHNMLWNSDGKLTVLDFEYAGWDHPLREIGNFLAHSKMRGVSKQLKDYFVDRYLLQTTLPQHVTCDLEAFRMLSEIEWVMVNMSYLLPSRKARLQQLKGFDYDVDALLKQFMQEIRERITTLSEKYL